MDESNGEGFEIAHGQFYEVYAIDPNAQLSSDEDEKDDITQNNISVEYNENSHDDYEEQKSNYHNIKTNEIAQDQSDFCPENIGTQEYNLDSHVVSHIDEYFVKQEKDDCDDNYDVADLDEYFNKEEKITPSKSVEGHVVKNVDEYFIKDSTQHMQQSHIKVEPNLQITHDPEVLPHIENIKRFLLDGIPGTKVSNKLVQRSCSLPHSPAHLSNLNNNEVKPSLSFEDLNINELQDFPFDFTSKNTYVNSDLTNKDEPPRILTDEDVNGFFVTTKMEKSLDDFNQQDMEIENPVETKIQYPSPTVKVKIESSSICKPKSAASNVLDFCVEKDLTKVSNSKKSPLKVKMENDEDIDVESYTDNITLPVLEANNLNSLLEQFEATEKLNKNVKIIAKEKKNDDNNQKIKPTTVGNGTRLQAAALHLNKAKLRQIKVGIFYPYQEVAFCLNLLYL